MLFHKYKRKPLQKRRSSLALDIPRRFTSLKNRYYTPGERAVLCTFCRQMREASLTVEAAVIVPLFLIAMFTLIFTIDLCRVYVIEQVEIGKKAKQLGTYAYLTGEYMQDPYVDLYERYSYKLPVSLIPNGTIDIALRGRVHAWVGRTAAECEADRNAITEQLVYVTDHQAVYHTNSACTYLELSVYAVDQEELNHARNQSGGRYKACEKCQSGAGGGTYYITDHGDRYHSSRSCSGLTRNVRLLPLTDVSGLNCCSRCQGGL